MRHLTDDTLARLVDESPTEAEESHLRACSACAERLRKLEEQTEALASLPALRPPSDDWHRLEARLRREGLVRASPSDPSSAEEPAGTRVETVPTPSPRHAGLFGSSWLQAAAALVLFLGGTAFGAWMEPGASAGPGTEGASAVNEAAPSDGLGSSDAGVGVTATSAPGQNVSGLDEAAARVRTAEERYVDALLTYRNLLRNADTGGDGAGTSEDPMARFAALEALVAASQEGIRQAPADPFFNGVLASTMAERQAAIRQISTSDDDSWF